MKGGGVGSGGGAGVGIDPLDEVADAVGLLDGVPVDVGLDVGVGPGEPVPVGVGDAVGFPVGVAVGRGVGVGVGTGVGVGVGTGVGVAVGIGVGVGVGTGVGVGVGAGVGVGVGIAVTVNEPPSSAVLPGRGQVAVVSSHRTALTVIGPGVASAGTSPETVPEQSEASAVPGLIIVMPGSPQVASISSVSLVTTPQSGWSQV
jgi:hypothetical protein